MFNLDQSHGTRRNWNVHLELDHPWNIGLIVGPSGCGKSTIGREVFGDHFVSAWDWDDHRSILDSFPTAMSIKDITELLSSVGFSTPPSWLRPYHALSNGEQFRVHVARTLAEMKDIAVIDEFTSVVDRTVAQIGSAAVAKTVRRRKQKLIALSCHYDIIDWLDPDWVYEPHLDKIVWRSLRQRPPINLEIRRVDRSAWEMFRQHHYLSTEIHQAAQCFVASWKEDPVAFASFVHFPHPSSRFIKREHRTVCLPDFQGVGIGNALSDTIAGLCRAMGYRYMSITTHPAMIRARARSKNWKMIAKPNAQSKTFPSEIRSGNSGGIANRLRASFEYVGPKMDHDKAVELWG